VEATGWGGEVAREFGGFEVLSHRGPVSSRVAGGQGSVTSQRGFDRGFSQYRARLCGTSGAPACYT